MQFNYYDMKRCFIIFALLAFVLVQVQAQDVDTVANKKNKKSKKEENPTEIIIKETKVEVFRDRLLMDIYHSFWLGMPSKVDYMKFNPGFNISALWDFKVSKTSPVSFGLGLGVSYFSQFTDALLKVNDNWVMQYNIIDEDIKYKLNRVNYINCNLPIEFRIRTNGGFKFTVGARVGLIAEVSQNYKGPDPQDATTGRHYKNREIYNTQNYSVEVYTRIGWKPISFFYAVHLTKIFTADKGPAMFPMSLGISLCFF